MQATTVCATEASHKVRLFGAQNVLLGLSRIQRDRYPANLAHGIKRPFQEVQSVDAMPSIEVEGAWSVAVLRQGLTIEHFK